MTDLTKYVSLAFSLSIFCGFSSYGKVADIAAECQKQSKTKAQYSICLDETMKATERQLTAWVNAKELELVELTDDPSNNPVLSQFKKANAFYNKFIESQCRSVFFEKQKSGQAPDIYRLCKITEIKKRIKQLELEDKQED